MTVTPDPGYGDFLRRAGTCGCGVPRTAERPFHETGHCDCQYHDPQFCPAHVGAEEQDQAEAWLADNRTDLDTLMPALETYLAAVAEHGPLD